MLLSTNAQIVLLTANAARSQKLPCMIAQPHAKAPTPGRAEYPRSRSKRTLAHVNLAGKPGAVPWAHAKRLARRHCTLL